MNLSSQLPTPLELQQQLPLSSEERSFLHDARRTAQRLIHGQDPRHVAIVGPCSIHDAHACIEYGTKLAELQSEIQETTFLICRVFIEKSRSLFGWKGFIYDPLLDCSHRMDLGLARSRSLLIQMSSLRIPCALEFVDPLIFPYFTDLLTWGCVGARTAASQIHRQMASGASFPIGFKNDLQGRWDEAICGILASRIAHTHLGINAQGNIAAITTQGNPFTHLILRGGDAMTNFDAASIAQASAALQRAGLPPHLLVDCAHGNSSKQALKQIHVFESILAQITTQTATPIRGWMLESHLHFGNQSLSTSPQYGISITDECLGWTETEMLLRESHRQLS